MSQLSHAQFPLRRHPDLLVDHRRARSAAVAEPRGANDQSRDRLRWPASFRNGGRDQIGTVADIKSESLAGMRRNSHVAARTLVPSPICDALHRGLQPFRHLHDCSGCFRLERLPGGACTHWNAPPSHGAHVERSLRLPLNPALTEWPAAEKSFTSGIADFTRVSFQQVGLIGGAFLLSLINLARPQHKVGSCRSRRRDTLASRNRALRRSDFRVPDRGSGNPTPLGGWMALPV